MRGVFAPQASDAAENKTLLFSGNYAGAVTDYISGNPGAGDRTEFIISFWFKRDGSSNGTLCNCWTANGDTTQFAVIILSGGTIRIDGWFSVYITSINAFNDNDFHHVLVSVDTSQATAADRIKLYVDGADETTMTTAAALNGSLGWYQNANHFIGRLNPSGSPQTYNGIITQFLSLSGVSIQAGDYAVSDFYDNGPVIVEDNVMFGPQDFFISHQDRGWLSRDFSGNDHDFTLYGNVAWKHWRPYVHDVLYLPFDGADASTVIEDKSIWRAQGTAQGNAQLDTAQSKFGGSSLYLDGTGDYVSFPASDKWNLAGLSEFTIGFWVKWELAPAQSIFITDQTDGNSFWAVEYTGASLVFRAFHVGVAQVVISRSWLPSANTWYYIEVIKGWGGTPNNYAVTVDGTILGAAAVDASEINEFTGELRIGRQEGAGSVYFRGWLEDLFILKGEALHTANFTVPTRPRGESQGHPEFFTTVFGPFALDSDSSNLGDYSVRQIAASLNVSEGSFDELRITYEAGFVTGLNVDNASVGIRSGSTDDTITAPTELLFSAVSGFSLSAGGSITSDWTPFSFDASDDLLAVYDISTGTQQVRFVNSGSDGDYIDPNSNTYDDATVSMIFTANRCVGVQLIETKTEAAA